MLMLAVCLLAAAQPEAGDGVPEEIEYGSAAHAAGFLTGEFSNQRQWENAGPEREREPVAGDAHEWLDVQFASHTLVEAPELGEHVIYLEWRSGSAEGEISRQRIWVLREDENGALGGFDFFTFRDPAPFAGRADEPGAFAGLTAEDLIGYPEGCLAQAHAPAHVGYYFAVDPQTCRITAQSGTQMRIYASVRALGNSLTYREQGTMEDNTVVFRVPGVTMPYGFVRVRDSNPE
jgi:hypothetical protein